MCSALGVTDPIKGSGSVELAGQGAGSDAYVGDRQRAADIHILQEVRRSHWLQQLRVRETHVCHRDHSTLTNVPGKKSYPHRGSAAAAAAAAVR